MDQACHTKIGLAQKWSPEPISVAKNGPLEPLLVVKNGPLEPIMVLVGPNLVIKTGPRDHFWQPKWSAVPVWGATNGPGICKQ